MSLMGVVAQGALHVLGPRLMACCHSFPHFSRLAI